MAIISSQNLSVINGRLRLRQRAAVDQRFNFMVQPEGTNIPHTTTKAHLYTDTHCTYVNANAGNLSIII